MTGNKLMLVLCILLPSLLLNAAEVAEGDWIVSTAEGRIQIVYRDWEIIRADEINLGVDTANQPSCSLYSLKNCLEEKIERKADGTTITMSQRDEKAGINLTRIVNVRTDAVHIAGTVTVFGQTGAQQKNMVGLAIPPETFPDTGCFYNVSSKGQNRTLAVPEQDGRDVIAFYTDELAWTNENAAFRIKLEHPSAGKNTNWPALTKWALYDRRGVKTEPRRFRLHFGSVTLEPGDRMQYGYTVHGTATDH